MVLTGFVTGVGYADYEELDDPDFEGPYTTYFDIRFFDCEREVRILSKFSSDEYQAACDAHLHFREFTVKL